MATSAASGPGDQLRFNSELIEVIGNPVYLKDREGRFLCVNRAWEAFYGIKREDCIGKTVHEVFPPEVAAAHQSKDDGLFAGLDHSVYELSVRAADGKMHDAVYHKTVFSGPDGEPAGVIGSLTDITSLKRTENALRVSELQLRLISDNAPAQIAYLDSDWRCSFCNQAYANWFGVSMEDIRGKHLRDIAGDDIFADIENAFARAYSGEHVVYERLHHRKDGSIGHILVTLSPHLDHTGKVVGVYDLVTDITERKFAEAELARSRERLHFALRGSNLSMWDANLATDEIYFSPEWAEMLGFPPGETLIGAKALLARVHPDDRARIARAIDDAIKDVTPSYREEHRLITHSGQWKWIESRGMVVERNASGQATRMTGTNADITERKEAEAKLRAGEAQLRLVVDNVPALIAYLDMDRRYRFVNKRYAEFFGVSADDIIGRHGREIIGEQAYAEYITYFDKVLSGEPVWYQRKVMLKNGEAGFIEVTLVPHIADDGRVIGAYVLSRDVTRYMEAESRIHHMAKHDPLTDLLNRREFEHRLRAVLIHPDSRSHALIYLNADQLKVVNDSCGHAAGDELLRQIAAVLRNGISPDVLLARLGSDEFGILLETTAPDDVLKVAEKLRVAAQALRFSWQDRSFPVSISIGVVALAGQSVGELLTSGDAACRIAKNRGRNRIHVYHPRDSEIALRRNQIEWRTRILQALEQNRFRLYWQPIITLAPSVPNVLHHEVLLRMLDDNGEPIAPMAFIPSAEHFDLMPLIDRWVVSAALAAHAKNLRGTMAAPGALLSINLSGQTLGDEEFPAFLHKEFERNRLEPSSICFEITETAAISDFASARSFIKEFDSLGCRFSLDDFGSGMSSFGYLRNLPVDYLKIDGSFIRNICTDAIDLAMVESINQIGHIMGKQTIAECVEDDAALALLRTIGVDHAQGYGIGKPRPMEDVADASR